ncbi:MAG TPA: hypothetical protein VIE46_04410 [Gemmatimonadales bacterium]
MRRTSGPIQTALLLAALACTDSTGPVQSRPPAQLNILRLAPTAPPLFAASTTFNACNGSGAEGRLFFSDGKGGQGEEFARLKLDNNTLLLKPDGTPFGASECIQITMAVDDPTQVLVRLEPTGLRFNPVDPAEFRIEYAQAEGVDSEIEAQIAIWRQETAGAPFVQIGSAVLKDQKEVEGNLLGFSRYALAY